MGYLQPFFHLFLVVLLFVAGCSGPAPRPDSAADQSGLLWKVQAPDGGAPSYVFGTIHSEDPRVTNYSSVVQSAFEDADVLALEIEFTPEAASYASKAMFFDDGRTLAQIAGDDTFRKVVDAMASRGIPDSQLSLMKPWSVFTMLNMPESDSGVFLDVLLFQRARQSGKSTMGLESIQEQISALDDMPMPAQLELLRDSLAHQDTSDELLEKTIETYLTGDLEQIQNLSTEFLKDVSPATAEVFNQFLIDRRNRRMVDRALPLIPEKQLFIAIGALHLPGENGVLALFRRHGYRVQSLD